MSGMTTHPHEIEEIESQFGPRLWDATPGVCCAAFQLGACVHTESYGDPYEELSPEDRAELAAAEERYQAQAAAAAEPDAEPF